MSTDDFSPTEHLLDRFLANDTLPASDTFACPYLSGLIAQNEGFMVHDLSPEVYRSLLDRGFRRSGRVVYRPICTGCRECRQIRVAVDGFRPSRSQRRVWRINRDVSVTFSRDPNPTRRKWSMFRDYLHERHDQQMSDDFKMFVDFLYDSPTETVELAFHIGRRLVGVSIVDTPANAWSSVYMFFDPRFSDRSLGVFSILWEIDYCRSVGIAYYYLGYYVEGARTMAYKARFNPHELLDESFAWRRHSCD